MARSGLARRWATPWLKQRAALTPSRPALDCGPLQLGFHQLQRMVEEVAGMLRAGGVRSGDIVAVQLPGSAGSVLSVHALQTCGAVMLPLNTRLAATELGALLRRWPVRFVLSSGRAEVPDQSLRRASLELRLPTPEVLSLAELVGTMTKDDGPGSPGAALRSAQWLVPTSGTGGMPKGVVLGAENLLASAGAARRLLSLSADDRWLLCVPLFHVAGLALVTRCTLLGSTIVHQSGFDEAAVSAALEFRGVTHLSLVPTMLRRLLDWRRDKRCPAHVRCVLLGGAPLPDELLREALALGYPIAPTYGMTETASQVATCPPAQLSGAGSPWLRPLPGTEIRVTPLDGGAERGEIRVRGPTVMRGYLAEDASCRSPLQDGWLATGDIGRLDPRGHLQVCGRMDDLIISGGENLYPVEIEAVLQRHPAVAVACVVPRSDPCYGQRPVAYWTRSPGCNATALELAAFCRAQLGGFKVPVAFHCVASLPRSPTGKVLRRQLRD